MEVNQERQRIGPIRANWSNQGVYLDDRGKHDEGIALNKLGRTANANEAFAKAKELGYAGLS